MLKGLYFKLHDDNEEENKIIEFFRDEAKEKNISKMQLLKLCIHCYKWACKMEKLHFDAFKWEGIEND